MVSIFTAKVFFLDLNSTLIFGSILMAAFPDLDFLMVTLEYGYTGKYAHNHRHLFHYPIIYILLFGILVFAFFGIPWLVVFLLTSIIHFIHDSIGIGWGTAWMFPFNRRSYKFFTSKENKFSKNFVVSWDQKELNELVELHGDPHWIKNIYLRLTPILVIELSVFILSLLALFLYLK